MRELNFESIEHRKLLVETFVNSVVLYDKRIELVLNYKDGARSLTFEEMGIGSDMSKRAPPEKSTLSSVLFSTKFALRASEIAAQ